MTLVLAIFSLPFSLHLELALYLPVFLILQQSIVSHLQTKEFKNPNHSRLVILMI